MKDVRTMKRFSHLSEGDNYFFLSLLPCMMVAQDTITIVAVGT